MVHTVFISYSTGDENYVRHTFETLNRLNGVQGYVAEWVQAAGTHLDSKVMSGLNSARCLIALITLNSQNSQWLNQEIGYAIAKGTPIIPIKEDGVNIKGFLEGKEYIKLEPANFAINMSKMITRLRNITTGLLDMPIVFFKIHCPHCSNQFGSQIPSQTEINQAVRDAKLFYFVCNRCKTTIYVNPLDLSTTSYRAP